MLNESNSVAGGATPNTSLKDLNAVSDRNDPETTRINIIDIRRPRHEESLPREIHKGLNPGPGEEKSIPTLLLYDEKGLKLFEDITYLEEYYLTNAEIEILQKHALDIAKHVEPNSIIVELGSGNLRKVNILLEAINHLGKNVEYYALDLSEPELQRTLKEATPHKLPHVSYFGLHGTYDDGLEWLKRESIAAKQKMILSLGSSVGNFTREEAAAFLKSFAQVLGPRDHLLIGIDSCVDSDRVFHAYNDRENVTNKFYMNGLMNANQVLNEEAFKLDEWNAIGEYSAEKGCHQAYVTPSRDVQVAGSRITAGEKVWLEVSYKYSAKDLDRLWNEAELQLGTSWMNKRADYAMHLLSKEELAFCHRPEQYATNPVPSWSEWKHLWTLWDTVTRQMIPDRELKEKPIKLRNACIFYLGHIPTFLDIKLSETTDGRLTEPKGYAKIFERGIDPDVENPEDCHAHSEVPDEWPPLPDILAHQDRVRARVKSLYDSGAVAQPKVQRCLWLGYEHEAMHLETLLYMLVQSEKTLKPPLSESPNIVKLAEQANREAVQNDWVFVPDQDLTINLNDPETETGPARYFGWDIEKPSRNGHVKSFVAKARPITNMEYAKFLLETDQQGIPASWRGQGSTNGSVPNGHAIANGNGQAKESSFINGHNDRFSDFVADKTVRTVYGGVPLSQALHWPVAASYDELSRCAAYFGGRIPTFEETRAIYQHAERVSLAKASSTLGHTIPAVNGHLVNDGVEESPPQDAVSNGLQQSSPKPDELFVGLEGCNVGFQNWHPMPVTQKGGRLCGQGDFGGLWEWTSSALEKHDGFEPMPLYPAYSQDFFDGKHNIVLGGSWATVPRIAGRKTFINWYQHNYPYVWAGARLVKDA